MRNSLIIVGLTLLVSCGPLNKLNRITQRLDDHLEKHPELRDAFDTSSFTHTDSTNVALSIDETLELAVDSTAVEELISMIVEAKAKESEMSYSEAVVEEVRDVEEPLPLTRRVAKAITNEVLRDKKFNLDVPIIVAAPDTTYSDTLKMNIWYSGGELRVEGDVDLSVETQKTTVDITYKEFGTFWVWLKDEKTLFLIAIISILVFGIIVYFWIKTRL